MSTRRAYKIEVPSEEGVYESEQFPLAEHYNAYVLANGELYEAEPGLHNLVARDLVVKSGKFRKLDLEEAARYGY